MRAMDIDIMSNNSLNENFDSENINPLGLNDRQNKSNSSCLPVNKVLQPSSLENLRTCEDSTENTPGKRNVDELIGHLSSLSLTTPVAKRSLQSTAQPSGSSESSEGLESTAQPSGSSESSEGLESTAQPTNSESGEGLESTAQSTNSESGEGLESAAQSTNSESGEGLESTAQPTNSESGEGLESTAQPTNSESGEGLESTAQPTNSESGEGLESTAQPTNSESGEGLESTAQPTNSESGEGLESTAQPTNSESGEGLESTAQPTNSESGEGLESTAQPTNSESGEGLESTAKPTNSESGEGLESTAQPTNSESGEGLESTAQTTNSESGEGLESTAQPTNSESGEGLESTAQPINSESGEGSVKSLNVEGVTEKSKEESGREVTIAEESKGLVEDLGKEVKQEEENKEQEKSVENLGKELKEKSGEKSCTEQEQESCDKVVEEKCVMQSEDLKKIVSVELSSAQSLEKEPETRSESQLIEKSEKKVTSDSSRQDSSSDSSRQDSAGTEAVLDDKTENCEAPGKVLNDKIENRVEENFNSSKQPVEQSAGELKNARVDKIVSKESVEHLTVKKLNESAESDEEFFELSDESATEEKLESATDSARVIENKESEGETDKEVVELDHADTINTGNKSVEVEDKHNVTEVSSVQPVSESVLTDQQDCAVIEKVSSATENTESNVDQGVSVDKLDQGVISGEQVTVLEAASAEKLTKDLSEIVVKKKTELIDTVDCNQTEERLGSTSSTGITDILANSSINVTVIVNDIATEDKQLQQGSSQEYVTPGDLSIESNVIDQGEELKSVIKDLTTAITAESGDVVDQKTPEAEKSSVENKSVTDSAICDSLKYCVDTKSEESSSHKSTGVEPLVINTEPASGDGMDNTESPPRTPPRGNYNIDWDNFDLDANPFKTGGTKLGSSPPVGGGGAGLMKAAAGEDFNPFKSSNKMANSPPRSPVPSNNNNSEEPIKIEKKVEVKKQPVVKKAPAKTAPPAAVKENKTETPPPVATELPAPAAKELDNKAQSSTGEEKRDEQTTVHEAKKKPTGAVAKGPPKRFRPPVKPAAAQNDGDEIQIFMPGQKPTAADSSEPSASSTNGSENTAAESTAAKVDTQSIKSEPSFSNGEQPVRSKETSAAKLDEDVTKLEADTSEPTVKCAGDEMVVEEVNPFKSSKKLANSPPGSPATTNNLDKLDDLHKLGSVPDSTEAVKGSATSNDSNDKTSVSDSNQKVKGEVKDEDVTITGSQDLSRSQLQSPEDDDFQPAMETFSDPTQWDLEMLEQFGNKGELQESTLGRQSLYVKFDPLVKGHVSPDGVKGKSKVRKTPACATVVERPKSSLTDRTHTIQEEESFNCSHGDMTDLSTISLLSGSTLKESGDTGTQARLLSKERDWTLAMENQKKESEGLESEKIALQDKILRLQKSHEDVKNVISEYEATIQKLIAEKEKTTSTSKSSLADMIAERDQALSDLASVESAFSDLHRRYEKTKSVVEAYKKNEETLKKCVLDYQTKLKKSDEKYLALKTQAEQKLEEANLEIEKVKKSKDVETVASQALLRKSEIQVQSLERALEQKKKEVAELTSICDELIAKVK